MQTANVLVFTISGVVLGMQFGAMLADWVQARGVGSPCMAPGRGRVVRESHYRDV